MLSANLSSWQESFLTTQLWETADRCHQFPKMTLNDREQFNVKVNIHQANCITVNLIFQLKLK